MAVSIEVGGQEIVNATEWESLHVREAIGEPDSMSVDVLTFVRGDEAMTAPAIAALLYPDQYLYTCIRRETDIVFSGLVRKRGGSKPAIGVIKWSMVGDGWEYLAPLRLVGAPDGTIYVIQEDGDADRLPTPVAIDPSANGTPIPASISALWANYWQFPTIDLTTFVFDILPVDAPVEEIQFSGTDVAGATSELVAAGSAAGLWWLANDSPDPQSTTAPNLALHVGAVVMLDEGDDGDDLLAGFPSADFPTNVAPYEIDNDSPNGLTTIMATHTTFDVDLIERRGAGYVRGATGFSEEVVGAPIGFPIPYQIAGVIEGGTGWVNGFQGPTAWGEAYIDAPAAVSPAQRDAFGTAYLASRQAPEWTGTVKVVGYHGWHKGQALRITDADWGLAGRWFLIRAVEWVQHDPLAEAIEYTLTVGETLSAKIGHALRQQRLKEQRQEIRPATQFIPYVGDLQLAPEETAPLTMQLANDAKKAMAVKGVVARWGLWINGVEMDDPEDTDNEFFLTDVVSVTDELGQITATLNAHADATADDAAKPWAAIAAPP